MKTRMSQVIVYISDMEKSVRFYRDILGLANLAVGPVE